MKKLDLNSLPLYNIKSEKTKTVKEKIYQVLSKPVPKEVVVGSFVGVALIWAWLVIWLRSLKCDEK